MQSNGGVTNIEFAAPHADLRPYITTYYTADIESADGRMIEDMLHPEWGSIRYVCRGTVLASAQPDPLQPIPSVVLVGHGSRATRIGCTSMRIASFGLLPLGWHHFVGIPAHRYADMSVAAQLAKTRIDFVSLQPMLAAAAHLDDVVAIFDNALLHGLMQIPSSARQEDVLIQKLHYALLDPDMTSVVAIADHLALSGTQLERMSKRVFGFPPKLLLRRQRFLRTLAIIMRQPSSKWAEILDPQYHDQAHFNRDFQRFFGMSPSQYMTLDKPIVTAGVRARMQALGIPLQGLHSPGIAV